MRLFRTRSASKRSNSFKSSSNRTSKSTPTSPLPPPQSFSPPSPRSPKDSPPDFVKRRTKIPLLLLDRPFMSSTEFLIDSRYRNLKLIGAGSYAIVVSAIDSLTNTTVAIKKILSAFASSRMARHTLREIRLLRHLKHPHIVQLLDIDVPHIYESWDEVYLVTPALTMDLRSALDRRAIPAGTVTKRVAYQLLVALAHLHSKGIMHRDVKSRNVLLDDNLNVQLCDLGHSRFYSKANREDELQSPVREPELTGGVTTIIQSAPELSLGAPYDAEVDIWAAACVIAELLHPEHRFLFDNTGRHSHIQEIIDVVGFPGEEMMDSLPEFGSWYLKRQKRTTKGHNRVAELLGPKADPLAVDLLIKMLRFSPKDRLSARKALEHPWFDEVRGGSKDGGGSYDFAMSEPPRKTSKGKLKDLVWGEVVAFHPEAPALGVH
eukprot:GFKZ01015100.1.p1 GENE.GFKZ01015100.1~~GFKZ01015100.1.p1  ORF type:complete len:434 (+),score=55.12 GFKZ01015100.1:938-2239(+)